MRGAKRQHMLRSYGVAFMAASCVALMLTACGPSATQKPSTSTKSGGSLTYALDEDIPGWNVNTSADAEYVLQEVMNLIWPQTFLINAGLKPYLNTQLLKSAVQTSTKPQTIVYTINSSAKWADGQPIDAGDYFYNWAAQSGVKKYTDINGKAFDDASNTGYSQIKSLTGSKPAGGAACTSAVVTGIGSIPCANGKTVTVVFSTPFADWQSLFGDIVPAHTAAKVGWDTGFQNWKNVTSGSWYTISNYVENQYIVLKKNTGYWTTPANLASITFQIFNGDTQAVPAMQNGEVQVINPLEVSLSTVQQASKLAGVTKSLIGGLQFQHIDFNESDPYLAIKSVRQAIAYGTDRKQIAARTVGEYDKNLTQLDSRVLVPSQPGFKANGSAYDKVNVSKATSLLASVGLKPGSDGYVHPTTGPQAGKDLTFTIQSTSGNDLRSSIEQLFQADMKTIGIKIIIQNEDASTLFGTTLPKGQYQITLFSWVATPFISGNLSIYCSYTNTAACGENWVHYANPQVDQLMTAGAVATSNKTEVSDFNKADQILWNDMVTLPLFQAPVFTVWANKYANIVPNASNVGITWNAQNWGVKAA